MSKGNLALSTMCILILLALGCSSGGSSPVAPGAEPLRASVHQSGWQTLLGLYEIEVDAAGGTANIVPLRGPEFQINVVKFLQPPAGNPANLGVKVNPDGTDIPNGIIDLDISITHPFPGSNLRGFDVRGIVLGDKGTEVSQFDYEVQYPKPSELRVLNADGYTRWWNAVEFLTPGLFGYTPTFLGKGNPKSTVNGYKYFADGLGASDPMNLDIAARGTFSTQTDAGDPNTLTREYILKFPVVGGVPQIKFRYAICASFAACDPGTPPPAPIDTFPPEANCQEPYQVSVTVDPGSTAYWTSTGSGGDLIMNIEIFDWQAPDNPEGVPGEIGQVRLESPTLWTGLKDPIASGTPIPTTNPTSSAWQVEIKKVIPTDAFQDVFITVQSADPTSYEPPVPGSGIYPGGAVLSAYFLATLELPGNSPPQIGTISGPDKFVPGVQLKYKLSSASDLQDGSNLSIEWDFDNDGVFADDEDGSDTNLLGSYTFTGDQTCYVQCRVYDTALAYTDSNVLTVEPMSLPFIDPMDTTTEGLWTVQNGIFDVHYASIQWNVQNDHWSTSSSSTGYYQDDMNTTLISPILPAGDEDTVTITISHRYNTESGFDTCVVYYRKNGGSWTALSGAYTGISVTYPQYEDTVLSLGGLSPGDSFEIAFSFDSDSSVSGYPGWDITNVSVIDNKPPVIQGIYGPTDVDSLGPWAYSTVATDLDGIASYMWSVEQPAVPPVYDDPGDGMGGINVTFPADGKFDIWVQVTDAGDPPLSSTFGPYQVIVFFTNPDAFFSDHFDSDTGAWSYTGGIDSGSYQDFWHIETANSILSNVGPDGCYAETSTQPTEKTASIDITFPDDSVNETRFRMLHQLATESGGGMQPYDGQWVTLDGDLIEPSYGFLYDDSGGDWAHGYFVGYTDGYETSTFYLGTTYNDGLEHTLTFHSLSADMTSNCDGGWQVDYVELWQVE